MITQVQPKIPLYEQDFSVWIEKTAKLLKQRRFDEVDWDNLIEEIETMGRSEKKELKSRLIAIIEHLLKLIYWEAEKADNARGWRNTVIEQRNQLELVLEDSPSLKQVLINIFVECYQKERQNNLRKYELSSGMFPVEPCFTLEDVLNHDYLP